MTTGLFHLESVIPPNAGKAPVLCIHGLHAGTWTFEHLLPIIAARGYPAHAISLRGHPPNPALPDIGRQSLADFYTDAESAARQLDRPIVIGHSMGGLIALLLASNDLVRAAVLVSAAPPRGIPAVNATLLKRMPRYLPAMLLSRPFAMADRDIDEIALNRMPDETRPAIRRRFMPDSGRAVRQMALGLFAVPRERIRVPLLVIGADDDRFIPLSVAEKIAARYSATLHVARGHGHFFFGEPGWEKEAAAILDWMDGLSPNVRNRESA